MLPRVNPFFVITLFFNAKNHDFGETNTISSFFCIITKSLGRGGEGRGGSCSFWGMLVGGV